MPGQPGHGAGQHGHLRLRRGVPLRPAAPRRRRPELRARFRQRHHSATSSSTARRWRTASPSRASSRRSKSEDYWRDAGTVDAYFEANMDLTRIIPALDLYDRNWPIWTYAEITPPAKFVHDEDGRRGMAVSSLVSGGCIISGAACASTLLFTGVHVHSWATLDGAVVLPEVDDRPAGAPEPRRHRPRRADPRGPGDRRGPGARRPALPPHRPGHLPGHPADAGPPGGLARTRQGAFPGGMARPMAAISARSAGLGRRWTPSRASPPGSRLKSQSR